MRLQAVKCFLFLVVLCFSGISAVRSQNMSGIHFSGAVSAGKLAQYGAGGIGACVQGKFFVKERISIGFNAGWHYFFGQPQNFAFIPIRVNAEYYFRDEGAGIRPYAGSDLGLYISSYTGAARFNFGVAPGGGVLFELSDSVNLGLGVNYNIMTEKNPAMYLEPRIHLLYVFGMN